MCSDATTVNMVPQVGSKTEETPRKNVMKLLASEDSDEAPDKSET